MMNGVSSYNWLDILHHWDLLNKLSFHFHFQLSFSVSSNFFNLVLCLQRLRVSQLELQGGKFYIHVGSLLQLAPGNEKNLSVFGSKRL